MSEGWFVRLPKGQMLEDLEAAARSRMPMAEGDVVSTKCLNENRLKFEKLEENGIVNSEDFKFCVDLLTKEKKPLALLEFGCGMGTLPHVLRRRGCLEGVRYLGTDVSPFPLATAREKFPELSFELMNAEEVPREMLDGFDCVFARGVLCSCLNPVTALFNMSRCTSGHLLLPNLALTDLSSPDGEWVTTLFACGDRCYIFRLMDQDFMLGFLEHLGFDIVEHVRSGSKSVPVDNWEGGSFSRYNLHAVRRRGREQA